MKLVSYTKTTKYVDYFGFGFSIPISIKYIATDGNGEIYGYSEKPYLSDHWFEFQTTNKFMELGKFLLEGQDWRETLREV